MAIDLVEMKIWVDKGTMGDESLILPSFGIQKSEFKSKMQIYMFRAQLLKLKNLQIFLVYIQFCRTNKVHLKFIVQIWFILISNLIKHHWGPGQTLWIHPQLERQISQFSCKKVVLHTIFTGFPPISAVTKEDFNPSLLPKQKQGPECPKTGCPLFLALLSFQQLHGWNQLEKLLKWCISWSFRVIIDSFVGQAGVKWHVGGIISSHSCMISHDHLGTFFL